VRAPVCICELGTLKFVYVCFARVSMCLSVHVSECKFTCVCVCLCVCLYGDSSHTATPSGQ